VDLDALIAADAPPRDRLAEARSRLGPPAAIRPSAWPAFGAAVLAATAALGAAAAVILGGPALGEASTRTLPPVSHMAQP